MADTSMGAASDAFAKRISALLDIEEQKKEKDKKKKKSDMSAAIVQSFKEKDAKKQEMQINTLRASRMLGNPHMGGNRLASTKEKSGSSVPNLKQGPHVMFDAQSTARKVKLSDIAMARMR